MSSNDIEVVDLLSSDEEHPSKNPNRSFTTPVDHKKKKKEKKMEIKKIIYDVEDVLLSDEDMDLQVNEILMLKTTSRIDTSQKYKKKKKRRSSVLRGILGSSDDEALHREQKSGHDELNFSINENVSIEDILGPNIKNNHKKTCGALQNVSNEDFEEEMGSDDTLSRLLNADDNRNDTKNTPMTRQHKSQLIFGKERKNDGSSKRRKHSIGLVNSRSSNELDFLQANSRIADHSISLSESEEEVPNKLIEGIQKITSHKENESEVFKQNHALSKHNSIAISDADNSNDFIFLRDKNENSASPNSDKELTGETRNVSSDRGSDSVIFKQNHTLSKHNSIVLSDADSDNDIIFLKDENKNNLNLSVGKTKADGSHRAFNISATQSQIDFCSQKSLRDEIIINSTASQGLGNSQWSLQLTQSLPPTPKAAKCFSNSKQKISGKLSVNDSDSGDASLIKFKDLRLKSQGVTNSSKNIIGESSSDSENDGIVFKERTANKKPNAVAATTILLPLNQKEKHLSNRINDASVLLSDPIIDESDISFSKVSPIKFRTMKRSSTVPNASAAKKSVKRTKTNSENVNSYLTLFNKKQLTQANKVNRSKSEVSAEMIMNVSEELVKQFGITLESLKSQFQPSDVRVTKNLHSLRENSRNLSEIEKKGLDGVIIPRFYHDIDEIASTLLQLITWSKKTNKMYSESYNCFLPLNETYNLMQNTAAIYYNAEEFIADYQSGKFTEEFLKLKTIFYPKVFDQFILVLKGYSNLISKAKRKVNKDYTDKVRDYILGATTNENTDLESNQTNSKRTKRKTNKKALDLTVEYIEATLIDLQIRHLIYFFPINSTAEFLVWLKSITYAIGLSYYSKYSSQNSDLTTALGSIKSGNSAFENFQFALQQLKYVTPKLSERITEKYPSFTKLYNAAVNKNTLGMGHDGRRLVNSRVDKTIVSLFKSDDPDELLNDD